MVVRMATFGSRVTSATMRVSAFLLKKLLISSTTMKPNLALLVNSPDVVISSLSTRHVLQGSLELVLCEVRALEHEYVLTQVPSLQRQISPALLHPITVEAL